ncbi:MAG: cyanophycin synthetase, partial [Patescibacteria group bacterium]
GVPGRMDYVQEKPFAVVIDYAHTPDSLEKVYQTLLTRTSNKKLICVLGAAGGGRDRWKRPVLGRVAEKYCKKIVLTDEDPFDEDPMGILDQIESGFSKHQNKNYFRILDRREAIGKAILLARKGDTVIITGKGTEDWIRGAKNKKIPWNERKTVEELLAKCNHRD